MGESAAKQTKNAAAKSAKRAKFRAAGENLAVLMRIKESAAATCYI